LSFFRGLTIKQKAIMVAAGVVLIVCAFAIIMPEFWSAMGLPLPSVPWPNTTFRWIVGLLVLAMGCVLLSALFVPTGRE
jgi:uncharacterized membrane protein (DUF485 family)